MIDFGESGFRGRLEQALNAHERFARHTRWFDGSILLECGAARCWIKVYRGRVIETLDHMPPLGYTFKLTGSETAWGYYLNDERKWPDLVTAGTRYFASPDDIAKADPMRPPEIRSEGNVLEAQRLVQAISAIAEAIYNSAKGGVA